MTNSTLIKTPTSRNSVLIEGAEGMVFEAVAAAAPVGPQGMFSMGAFPSSLIALGRIKRRVFDDTLFLQKKRNPFPEELDARQRAEGNALANRIGTPRPTPRTHLPSLITPRASA